MTDGTPAPQHKQELLSIYQFTELKCPKCGNLDITFDKYLRNAFFNSGTKIADEKISRECRNCGYKEFFRPKDWEGEHAPMPTYTKKNYTKGNL